MNVVAFRTKVDGEWNDEEWMKPAERNDMDRDFQGWGSDVRKILRMMQKCDMWALFDHPPATTYHKDGKICLMGDAAHASTPHQGSGAGMAVEDAVILSGILGEIRDAKELGIAFETYEVTRKERTQRLSGAAVTRLISTSGWQTELETTYTRSLRYCHTAGTGYGMKTWLTS